MEQVEQGSHWQVTGTVKKIEGAGVSGAMGRCVVTISAAVGIHRRLQEYRITCWQALARDVCEFIPEGSLVQVSGYIKYRISGSPLFPKQSVELAPRTVTVLGDQGTRKIYGATDPVTP